MWQELLHQLQRGDIKALARSISFIENEQPGYEILLQSLSSSHTKIIGITGPPGAGKSTMVDVIHLRHLILVHYSVIVSA